MTQAVTQGSTSTYAYDFAGNRVSQVVGSTTTIYPNKFYSITSTTNGATTTATTTVYVWNGDTLIATIDQVTVNGANSGSSTTRYIHPDHLGSTNVVSDENGNIVDSIEYYPYGETRLNEPTYPTNAQRQFIGQFKDGNSLAYLNARYYDSSRGQFLTEDPVFWGDPSQQDLNNPQNLNSYSYAIDNPVNKSDPFGKHVELVSRPIDNWNGIPTSQLGAHAFVYVAPDNPATVGSISHVDTSQPFTLSGIPTKYFGGDLMKRVNDGTDSMYATCGTTLCPGSSRVTVAPPAGMTSSQFDAAVVASYNNLPTNVGPYWFLGLPRSLEHLTKRSNR
jgi:RHS repeat-associated protein